MATSKRAARKCFTERVICHSRSALLVSYAKKPVARLGAAPHVNALNPPPGHHVVMDWLKAAYFAPLRLIAAVMRLYVANRRRVAAGLARPWAKSAMTGAIMITAFAWLAIWLFAGEEHRDRLSEAIKNFWSTTRDITAPHSDAQ